MQTAIRMPIMQNQPHRRSSSKKGINIGCCRVCTCFNMHFLSTKTGLLKIFELLLGSCCEALLVRFGLPAAADMGEAFHSFLTTVSACLTTTFILTLCYFLSSRTYSLIRQSIFEIFFNAFACFLYISASSYMGFATNVWLHPIFLNESSYVAYPAMTCVYYVGGILSIVYGMDAFIAYKEYRGGNS